VSIVKITKRRERIKITRPVKLTHKITLKSNTYTNKPGNNIVLTHGILFVKENMAIKDYNVSTRE